MGDNVDRAELEGTSALELISCETVPTVDKHASKDTAAIPALVLNDVTGKLPSAF